MARYKPQLQMDFFSEQRLRIRRSLLLYGLFVLIVLLHAIVALGIAVLLLTVFTGGVYYWALVLVLVWTLASFGAGSFFEYHRLKAGGRSIAQRVGAVRLFIDNSQPAWEHSRGIAHQHKALAAVQYSETSITVRHERDFPTVYRRYYRIAEQLALASGLSMPILYVLTNEQGINGFVAGRDTQDRVLVVTQGALDKLSDEALYGLIGHEYGHILHGDAKFNLQLMVVLAGLQILYDWSDPIGNQNNSARQTHHFYDNANQDKWLSQSAIDTQARQLEAQTANFSTHAEWAQYWRSTQASTHRSPQQSMLSARAPIDRRAPRSVWTLLLHGLSFSSMASAQLIKHSFNRERELLADATSIQLTRSAAILETLKAIHRDTLGSRISNTADINGLSHFFFASSGADLGDISWFATHPSLPERMSTISANDYQHFATQVAKEKRLNQQKIKAIYEQRRRGTFGTLKDNSLSSKNYSSETNKTKVESRTHNNESFSRDKFAKDTAVMNDDTGLEFVIEADVIIDGRLQVPKARGMLTRLQPWQASLDPDLPTDRLINAGDIQQVSLPHYVLNHSHHPLGAQALIEAVLLCHQGYTLSSTATYGLADIWGQLTQNFEPTDKCESNDIFVASTSTSTSLSRNAKPLKKTKVLPHTIDDKLFTSVAGLDRRMDSALIALALKQLCKHDLSTATVSALQQKTEDSHSNSSHQHYQHYQHYQRQLKSRTMLLHYQQGLIELFNNKLMADLTVNINNNFNSSTDSLPIYLSEPKSNPQQATILSLWQALHLQQLLPVLRQVLGEDTETDAYQQVLQAGVESITVQLDPSGQLFQCLDTAQQMMLIILAYRLANSFDQQALKNKRYVLDLRRYARLISIDLEVINDTDLQWLLLTAQNLNSIQLLAIINTFPIAHIIHDKQDDSHPKVREMAYNDYAYSAYKYNDYRLWLSTLHTAMLHDTIVSQNEYDCLTVLAERWLGVRQLVD